MLSRCWLLLILLSCLLSSAYACLNDRDTDAYRYAIMEMAEGSSARNRENRILPEPLEVIIGKFERNPPEYYWRRIARVEREIARTPKNLNLYDDIAVALDRVGRSDDAIRWIERKHHRLNGISRSGERQEDWYRYYANVGTFWAHRWLKNGARNERLAEMETARRCIMMAIAIKPDAHFGREKFQLAAMDWILATRRQPETTGSLFHFLKQQPNLYRSDAEAVVGVSGLVVLGAA